MTPLSRNQTPVSVVWSFFQPKSDEKRSKSLWIAEFHSRTRGRLLQKSLSPTIMHVDSTRLAGVLPRGRESAVVWSV
jgi:hypothetical protein